MLTSVLKNINRPRLVLSISSAIAIIPTVKDGRHQTYIVRSENSRKGLGEMIVKVGELGSDPDCDANWHDVGDITDRIGNILDVMYGAGGAV